jgi:hypothetical protein
MTCQKVPFIWVSCARSFPKRISSLFEFFYPFKEIQMLIPITVGDIDAARAKGEKILADLEKE